MVERGHKDEERRQAPHATTSDIRVCGHTRCGVRVSVERWLCLRSCVESHDMIDVHHFGEQGGSGMKGGVGLTGVAGAAKGGERRGSARENLGLRKQFFLGSVWC